MIQDNKILEYSEQDKLIDGIRYACLIMIFGGVSGTLVQLFIIDQVLSINQCKTLLLISEFGISLSCILFYFTHTVYHPSFIILLVITLGFFIQLHYNLPYLLIEYKMISIRHKETRRQYRILSYYCSLIEKQFEQNGTNGIANIDMTPFDSFKNSNKLMQIEQLKQRMLQKYNLALFFATIIVSICTGFIINYWGNHFVFSIVTWGMAALSADILLLILYLVYQSCWKPYKKRKRARKYQQQKELDEWKLKRMENASYYTFQQSLQEKGIKSFIKDKGKVITQNLNIFEDPNFDKNRPIQRASASTLQLFELKKDLRQKYKYKKDWNNDPGQSSFTDSNNTGSTTDDYLEYSTDSDDEKIRKSPLTNAMPYAHNYHSHRDDHHHQKAVHYHYGDENDGDDKDGSEDDTYLEQDVDDGQMIDDIKKCRICY